VSTDPTPAPEPIQLVTKTYERDLLLKDYELANAGYAHRDELVPKGFAELLKAFLGFLALLLSVRVFGNLSYTVSVIINILIGATGLTAMSVMLLDLQANSSCKKALRKRATEIEDILASNSLRHWRTINGREKFFEESLFKRPTSENVEGSTGSGFVAVARMLLLLWSIIAVAFVVWTDRLPFTRP
jgi:hypothetical protein